MKCRHAIPLMFVLTLLSALPARAGWSVGVSVHAPVYPRPYCYSPCYRPYYPIYVRPAAVYVQPVAVVEPAPILVAPPAPAVPQVAPQASDTSREGDVARYQQQLQSPEARDRVAAALQLGRLRAAGSQGALIAALNNDRSPAVREAAARALGLMGTTDALEALQRSAQVDDDKSVRDSAAYSSDVIRAHFKR